MVCFTTHNQLIILFFTPHSIIFLTFIFLLSFPNINLNSTIIQPRQGIWEPHRWNSHQTSGSSHDNMFSHTCHSWFFFSMFEVRQCWRWGVWLGLHSCLGFLFWYVHICLCWLHHEHWGPDCHHWHVHWCVNLFFLIFIFFLFFFRRASVSPFGDRFFTLMNVIIGDTIDVIGEAQTRARNPYKIGLYTSFAVPTAGHTWVLADGAVNSTIYLPSWTIVTNGHQCILSPLLSLSLLLAINSLV